MKIKYIECACGDMEHVLRLSYFLDDGELSIQYHLALYQSWHKRIWYAVKYIFGIVGDGFSSYTDVLIENPDTMQELIDFITACQKLRIEIKDKEMSGAKMKLMCPHCSKDVFDEKQ